MKFTKLALSLFALLPFVDNAFALNVNGNYSQDWGYVGRDSVQSTYGDFILAGGLGKSTTHGTFNDEWAVVGMVARQIVEHGGYFCPYQIQCANKRKRRAAWTTYYHPNGYSASKCAWLCESGYSGTNCMPVKNKPASCDLNSQNTSSQGKFAGISLKTSGGGDNMVEGELIGFDAFIHPNEGGNHECNVLLGIVKFMEHGVVAAPIRACCSWDSWKGIDSYVNTLGIAGTEKVLCASGYKPNSVGSDCEPINKDVCETQTMTFCSNFPKESYDSSKHTLMEDATNKCMKYICSDFNSAFPSANNTNCEPCSTGIRGGPNPSNGICVTCDVGEYFDREAGTCKIANAYSQIDMQYGKAQTKNTNPDVENQCWTVTTPEEYAKCVQSGGVKNSKNQ